MTPPHLQKLVDRGVITVDPSGVVRLTRAAWQAATLYTGYTENPMLHFVGFKDDRFNNAVRVWGRPDFIHRFYDRRAVADIAPGDTVVFAGTQEVVEFSFDDSANW